MKASIAVVLAAIALHAGGALAHDSGGGDHGGGGGGGRRNSASGQDSSAVTQDVKPANADLASLAAMLSRRHQQRSELYKQALDQLRANPEAASVADCKNGAPQNSRDVCIRVDTQARIPLNLAPAEPPATRKRIALLFGNNAYTGDPNIPRLVTPISDVKAVAEQLRSKFNYEVHIVTNAGKADFFREMNQLAGAADAADSVFIMYAGHGYEMEDTKMGYWIPVDAKSSSADNWISNKDIGRFLRAIPARQVILVSDSCFSGTLTQEQKIQNNNPLKRVDILRQRSVLALSSGGEEPVADEGAMAGHSVFAGHLLQSFDRLQDDTTGFELYRGLYDAVLKEFPQHPQYGAVLTAGHAGGGDYLIDVKAAAAK
jgi:hypothetical protein